MTTATKKCPTCPAIVPVHAAIVGCSACQKFNLAKWLAERPWLKSGGR